MARKVELVQTDPDAIRNAVSEAMQAANLNVDSIKNITTETVRNVLKEQKDEEKKQQHINKLLNNPRPGETKGHKHDDSCPNCHSGIKDFGDGVHICTGKDCGAAIIDKNAKFLICDDCDGPVPESFLGTDKTCPRCGGKGVHRHK